MSYHSLVLSERYLLAFVGDVFQWSKRAEICFSSVPGMLMPTDAPI